ncbi:MAG: hypothetical protein ALMCE001_10940 [Methanocorpusculum sp. MCE]|nr:MAG: hypothetical protein ALMCE001_10940 [Methanocorpusculum sp. MCE]
MATSLPPHAPPKKEKYPLFLDVFFFNLHSVLNRFHLIDIITKCSQHIFHSYSLQRCYLHQPCMKNMRISINPFFNANHDLRKIGYIPTPSPPQKKKNTHYSLTFFFLIYTLF